MNLVFVKGIAYKKVDKYVEGSYVIFNNAHYYDTNVYENTPYETRTNEYNEITFLDSKGFENLFDYTFCKREHYDFYIKLEEDVHCNKEDEDLYKEDDINLKRSGLMNMNLIFVEGVAYKKVDKYVEGSYVIFNHVYDYDTNVYENTPYETRTNKDDEIVFLDSKGYQKFFDYTFRKREHYDFYIKLEEDVCCNEDDETVMKDDVYYYEDDEDLYEEDDIDPSKIKPEYYKNGQFDVIDNLVNIYGYEAARDFCRGNIIKYITRFEDKNGLEDLKKAEQYIKRLKDLYEVL